MNKKNLVSRYMYFILALVILLTTISAGIITGNAKVNLKDELYLKRSDIYYFNYNKKTKTNIEKLMDKVDKLDDKKVCTRKKVNELWEEFKETIKTVKKSEMVGFFPDAASFEAANYKRKDNEPLTGYDQFQYVYRNLLYYACKYLPDKEMNEFIVQFTDDAYELCVWQYKKGNTVIELNRFFVVLDEIKAHFSAETQEIIKMGSNMLLELTNDIAANEKYKQTTTPSKAVEKQNEEYQQIIEEKNNETKEQMAAIEQMESVEPAKPSSSSNNNNNSNASYSDSYNDYFENLRNEYAGATENEGGDNGLYNIYYTVNKNDEKPEYVDSKIQVTKNKITYQNVCDVLKIFASKENFDCYDDSDAFMFIGEGRPLVINDIGDKTVENDIVNKLFDDFETLGLKVALEASEEENQLNDSLASKIENHELNEIDIHGSKLILTDSPILSNNIVQLPVKQILSEMDLELTESGKEYVITRKEDKDSNEIDETSVDEEENKHEFRLNLGVRKYSVNNTDGIFKTEPQIQNGILYVEMDSIVKAFGYEFSYNTENNCFVIK